MKMSRFDPDLYADEPILDGIVAIIWPDGCRLAARTVRIWGCRPVNNGAGTMSQNFQYWIESQSISRHFACISREQRHCSLKNRESCSRLFSYWSALLGTISRKFCLPQGNFCNPGLRNGVSGFISIFWIRLARCWTFWNRSGLPGCRIGSRLFIGQINRRFIGFAAVQTFG